MVVLREVDALDSMRHIQQLSRGRCSYRLHRSNGGSFLRLVLLLAIGCHIGILNGRLLQKGDSVHNLVIRGHHLLLLPLIRGRYWQIDAFFILGGGSVELLLLLQG